ncbi:stage II sporulation protein AB (anti-sigma F factor) [Evansella caseinilytica]|uniref:Anti-sigma F factor n=1 Tax=Evansella caseinilytica TaxID=1503961 RepID=A0A1H3L652_9BACI|nr:anti-sigma F factor [Evansella caseinilytica]SDY59861.1 stage II sporulation protein AB (anti-sigma F factor) [Evansella caseinilytica]
MKNRMELSFTAFSQNEAFARVAVGAFVAQLDPTMDELTEIKTVVSEAVTNAVIHGYHEDPEGMIFVEAELDLEHEIVQLTIKDNGVGIHNIEEARQPLYTSKPELERSGMGFTIMENFMDKVEIYSEPMEGTTVTLVKQLSKQRAYAN